MQVMLGNGQEVDYMYGSFVVDEAMAIAVPCSHMHHDVNGDRKWLLIPKKFQDTLHVHR